MPTFVKTDKQGRIPARSVTIIRGRGGAPRRVRIEVPRQNVAEGMTLGRGATRKFIPFRRSPDYDEAYDVAYRKRRGAGKRKRKPAARRRRPAKAKRRRSSSSRSRARRRR